MPNRYLRSSYIESEAVNSIPLEAEVFWTHLLVTVDDFGRYDASTKILRPKLFPLRLDQVSEQDIKEWLVLCDAAGLIKTYVVAGKPYLQMQKWEQGRASFSKFPQPPTSADGCEQMFTAANKCLPPHLSPTPTPTPIPTTTNEYIYTHSAGFEESEAHHQKQDSGSLELGRVKVASPTLSEVKAAAEMSGCPISEAEKFWHHFESSGWVDKNGRAIVKWQSKLAVWVSNGRSMQAEAAFRSKPERAAKRPEQNQIQENIKVRTL